MTLRQPGWHDVIRALTPRFVYLGVMLPDKDHHRRHPADVHT